MIFKKKSIVNTQSVASLLFSTPLPLPLMEQTHFVFYAVLLMCLRITSTQPVAVISVRIAITGYTCANNWHRETVKYLTNKNNSRLTLMNIKSCTK